MENIADLVAYVRPWLETLCQVWQDVSYAQGIDMLCLALPLGCLLAFAGLGCLSGTARTLAVTRKRSSYAKCARQLARLAVLLGLALCIGGRIWLFHIQGSLGLDTLIELLREARWEVWAQEGLAATVVPYVLLEVGWLLLTVALLGCSFYLILWKMLDKFPKLHGTVGWMYGVVALLATLVLLTALRLLAVQDASTATLTGGGSVPAGDTPLFWALCMTLPLAFALAGGFGAFWLVLRRKHDDFGRDHYNTMLPWCAVWARNAWLVFWVLLLTGTAWRISTQWQGNVFTPEQALQESVWLLLWLIPSLLWALPARSTTPLRHKVLLLVALLFSLSGIVPFTAPLRGEDVPGVPVVAPQPAPSATLPPSPPLP